MLHSLTMAAPRKGADLLLRATPGDRRFAASTRRYKARHPSGVTAQNGGNCKTPVSAGVLAGV